MFPTIPWSEVVSSIQRGTIAEIKEVLKDPWKLQTSARAEWIIIVLRPNLESLLPEGIEAWLWWIGSGFKAGCGPIGRQIIHDYSLWRQPLSRGRRNVQTGRSVARVLPHLDVVRFVWFFFEQRSNTHIVQLQFLHFFAASAVYMHMFSVPVAAKRLPSIKPENVRFGFLSVFFVPSSFHCHICGLFAHFVCHKYRRYELSCRPHHDYDPFRA